jgi:hypothetical protein
MKLLFFINSEMSSSDDDEIGQEVEKRYYANGEPKPVGVKPKRPYQKRLPMARRQQAIELKLLGKEDPEFHVIEQAKKGSYIVRKRAHPLPPVQEQAVIPSNPLPIIAPAISPVIPNVPTIAPTISAEPKPEIPVISYFNTQNSVNNSLSKELNELREMYGRLEAKYSEVKKTLKKSKKVKVEKQIEPEPDNDEPTEEEILAYEQYLASQAQANQPQPQPQIIHLRRPRHRVIDINRF